jgi:DNA replication protein DnaC
MKHNQYPIPKRYLEPAAIASLASVHPEAQRFARDWSGTSGAVLVGPTGCGKTLAAAVACVRVRKIQGEDSNTWVKWIRADELSRLLSERNSGESIQELKVARVLVIDELGYERFPELILEVLGARHDASRPTVVTSGLTLPMLLERYSGAVVRRVTEIDGGVVWDCWMEP